MADRDARAVATTRRQSWIERPSTDGYVAALYTLVATCEAHGVNPFEYLRDVLVRVSTPTATPEQ